MLPRIAETLAEAGFIAHRFNFSHSGMTNHVETFQRPDLFQRDTWNKQVFDLLTVIAAISGGEAGLAGGGLPLYLLGHSRGGATCLLTAGRLGDHPALATLAGIVSIAAPDTLNPLIEEQRRDLLRRGSIESPSSRTGQVLRVGRGFLEEQLQDPVGHDLLANVSRLRVPVLIIHGSADASVPVSAAARLSERLADRATVKLIDGADHTFNTPNPQRPDAPTSPQLAALLDAVLEFATAHVPE
jgi:pimeloyl-ACP methyl ester carboxylesterase